jgi:hypothetical protein
MTIQTVKLAGKRFVILAESDYRRLQRKAEALDAQESGDIAEAKRRGQEASITLQDVRKRLKL